MMAKHQYIWCRSYILGENSNFHTFQDNSLGQFSSCFFPVWKSLGIQANLSALIMISMPCVYPFYVDFDTALLFYFCHFCFSIEIFTHYIIYTSQSFHFMALIIAGFHMTSLKFKLQNY